MWAALSGGGRSWRLLEGAMSVPNALPADASVLGGANVVPYLLSRGKRLGFNTFRCWAGLARGAWCAGRRSAVM